MWNVKNKKVTVLGLARSGIAAANLLFEDGAIVRISDIEPMEKLKQYIKELISQDIEISVSANQIKDIENAELIIVSPGIPSDIPAIQIARKRNIPVISEIELAYQYSSAAIIAITGSNGKTTTTSLVGEIMKSNCSGPVVVAGNIGYPLTKAVKNMSENGLIIAEISSFQLENIISFKPKIAAILNITPNHLDRYQNMNSYANAKSRIFEFQDNTDYAVINLDDNETIKRISNIKSKKIYFSRKSEIELGAMIKKDWIITRWGNREIPVCKINELKIPGVHNLENALAAVAITLSCGIEAEKIKQPLIEFRGVEHRLELVREIAGVKYYNDSKATSVNSVISALSTLPAEIILIAGGKDKGMDYNLLKELISKKVKNLILIGESRMKIKSALNGSCPISESDSMADAVRLAVEFSRAGDSVLLSPGCASYDMFRDFEERGKVFKKIVSDLR